MAGVEKSTLQHHSVFHALVFDERIYWCPSVLYYLKLKGVSGLKKLEDLEMNGYTISS